MSKAGRSSDVGKRRERRCFSTCSSWTHVFIFPIKSPTHQARLTWKDGFCGWSGVNFTRRRTEMAMCHFSTFNVFASHTIIYTIELLKKKRKKITFPCTDLIESIQAKLWHCFVHCLNQVQQLSMPSTHLQSQKGPAADKATMRNQSYILQMANWQLKELTAPRSLSVTIDLQSLGSAHKPGNGGKNKKNQLESTSNNIESDIWSTHWTLIKLILQKDGVGIAKPTFHL